MKRYPVRLFIGIAILTFLAIIVDISPQQIISVDLQKPPFINKKISIHKTISGISPNFSLGGIQRDLSFKKGLDLEGGISITLQADMKGIPEDQRKDTLETVKTIIERRVNPNGTYESVIQTSVVNKESRIIAQLPGINDINEALRLVGTTGKLEFRSIKSATPSGIFTLENTDPTGLSGDDLVDATPNFNQRTGAPVVTFRIKDESQEKFFKATGKLIGKPMVIFLDTQAISAPTVQEAIRDNGEINGNFTTAQTKELASILKAGAIRVPLKIIGYQTIPATLGVDSLKKSLFAGMLGFMVIVIFMCVLYGRLGILASVALLLYTLYSLAVFKLIPITLTLAGIAGFVLSIGMAVDANILIFERMREELRRGKSKEISLELGFSRAWTSIRDSNISSIITSLILLYFGSGIVKGFAITLLIGVIVSMFSAIVVTRTFLRMIYK